MEDTIVLFLEHIGLSKNEIKIYLASLELGESGAAEIAERARVHRVAAYTVISGLIDKGFLVQSKVKRGRRISAQDPKHIESLLRSKRRQLRRLTERYESVLPELTTLFRHATVRPRVQFFEGVRGLEQINVDIINSLKELPPEKRITLSYANPNDIVDRFEGYMTEEGGYLDSRKKYGIFNRVIAYDGPVTRAMQPHDAKELREMIILNDKVFPFKNDITIYANKMAIMAFQRETIGVIIESNEIVDDQRAIFRIAWEGAKVLSAKK